MKKGDKVILDLETIFDLEDAGVTDEELELHAKTFIFCGISDEVAILTSDNLETKVNPLRVIPYAEFCL